MEYKIVEAGTPDELETEVQDLIAGGFEPLGGVSAAPITSEGGTERWWYVQAMIKPDPR